MTDATEKGPLVKAVEAALRDKIIDDDETNAGFWIPYRHLKPIEDALAAPDITDDELDEFARLYVCHSQSDLDLLRKVIALARRGREAGAQEPVSFDDMIPEAQRYVSELTAAKAELQIAQHQADLVIAANEVTRSQLTAAKAEIERLKDTNTWPLLTDTITALRDELTAAKAEIVKWQTLNGQQLQWQYEAEKKLVLLKAESERLRKENTSLDIARKQGHADAEEAEARNSRLREALEKIEAEVKNTKDRSFSRIAETARAARA